MNASPNLLADFGCRIKEITHVLHTLPPVAQFLLSGLFIVLFVLALVIGIDRASGE